MKSAQRMKWPTVILGLAVTCLAVPMRAQDNGRGMRAEDNGRGCRRSWRFRPAAFR